MHKADRVTAALLLAFAALFAAAALKLYAYSSESGPGSAFLPFWLGVVMAALALLMLVRRPRAAEAGGEWLPEREGRRRVAFVVAVTVAFVALLKPLGMIAATALYLAVVVRFFGKHPWWLALAVAAAAAAFNWLVFAHWLRVPFPEGSLWTF